MMKFCNLIGPLKINQSQIDFELPSYFVDGGTIHKDHFKYPKTSFGDGDSTNQPLDIKLDIDKDFSDTLYALKNIITNYDQINMYGFDGARFSHQLAIIGDTLNLLNKHTQKELYFYQENGKRWIFSSKSQQIYPPSYSTKGQFSLFSLLEQEVLYINTHYPIDKKPVMVAPLSSTGVSNKADKSFEIQAQYPYLIIFD